MLKGATKLLTHQTFQTAIFPSHVELWHNKLNIYIQKTKSSTELKKCNKSKKLVLRKTRFKLLQPPKKCVSPSKEL